MYGVVICKSEAAGEYVFSIVVQLDWSLLTSLARAVESGGRASSALSLYSNTAWAFAALKTLAQKLCVTSGVWKVSSSKNTAITARTVAKAAAG